MVPFSAIASDSVLDGIIAGTYMNIEDQFDELSGDQDNFSVHFRAYIYVTSEFTVQTSLRSDNLSYLYFDGVLKCSAVYSAAPNYGTQYQHVFTLG
jgi:hypothetical protein